MYRPELMQMLLASDPHSPPEYRVNGVVPNIPAFYEAFKIQPGDKFIWTRPNGSRSGNDRPDEGRMTRTGGDCPVGSHSDTGGGQPPPQ